MKINSSYCVFSKNCASFPKCSLYSGYGYLSMELGVIPFFGGEISSQANVCEKGSIENQELKKTLVRISSQANVCEKGSIENQELKKTLVRILSSLKTFLGNNSLV